MQNTLVDSLVIVAVFAIGYVVGRNLKISVSVEGDKE